ncbi:hypothetical protein DIPPA_29903 [Diplonema papillatum]|nr:hypothetical protein DIPPA_29903 [Diplonema papillatum]
MLADSSSAAIAAAAAVGLLALGTCCKKGGRKAAPSAALVPASRSLHPLATAGAALRPSAAGGLSVATFNILTKAFARREYGHYVPAVFRDWKTHRLPLLHATLANLATDVIAVQEACVLTFADDIAPFLSAHGYGLVAPYDKDAVKKGRGLAKTAILYRTAVLQLLWSQNRSRTVLAAFRHRATGSTVYVVNCHLEGNPVKARERFQQLRGSLAIVEAHWLASAAGGAAKADGGGRKSKRQRGPAQPAPRSDAEVFALGKSPGKGAEPPASAVRSAEDLENAGKGAETPASAVRSAEDLKSAGNACGIPAGSGKGAENPASAGNSADTSKSAGKGAETPAAGAENDPAAAQGGGRPFVIVTGDFNSSREHCVYRLLSEGSISPDFTDAWGEGDGRVTDTPFACPFPLKDAYAGCKKRQGTYLANSSVPTLIDFVFVSSSFTVEAARAPYTDDQFADALRTGVPNAWCVSDHFPLAAALTFPPPDTTPATSPP